MKRSKIGIVGGHGKVGQYIVESLQGYDVVLLGRSEAKMNEFMNKHPEIKESRIFDVHQQDFTHLEDLYVLIVCVDQKTTHLVEYCDKNQTRYMDVSANSSFFNQVLSLNPSQGSFLLGVGLAPGLSNLLAATLLASSNQQELKIQVILGLKDDHGEEAISWTIQQFLQSYQHKHHGRMRPFRLSSKTWLNDRKITTYNFNFADQHLLSFRYPNAKVTTYLGFDIHLVSKTIHFLAITGILGLLRFKKIQSLVYKAMKYPSFGSDIYKVSAQNEKQSISISGNNEAQMTGQIAGIAALKMVRDQPPKGIVLLNDIMTLESLCMETGLQMVNESTP